MAGGKEYTIMIAVFLSPVYILVNIYLIRWLFRWLKAVHPCLGKRRVKILISVIYLFFASALLAGFLLPAGEAKRFFMQLFDLMPIIIHLTR